MQHQTASDLVRRAVGILAPPERVSVAEWADRYRRLSPEASAAPGRWRTRVVEYMREPMECIGDPRYRRVAIVAAAQVAKSEVLLNAIGHTIHTDPAPILMMQPTLDMAQAFSKDRVAPMIRDTPELAARVSDSKSRDSGNTILHKTFPAGHLTVIGANSAAGLASRPIRDVYCDEVDRYPASAGTEGDPVNLAIKRTVTFWNRRIVLVSTPTVTGASRIWDAYEEGDQRQRWCPCPDCGHHQRLVWANVHWQKGRPETAAYACEECGTLWSDPQRVAAVRAGEWRASAEFNGVASFHIPGLLSPFLMLADAVREFLEAQGNPEKLKTWTNTFLGETWAEQGARVDSNALAERATEWEHEIPEGVTVLTAGIDVQDDRIECEVVGWGDDDVSWSIDYKTLRGDPTGSAVWDELRRYLQQSRQHPLFGELIIRAACLDTGHLTQQCYAFAKRMQRVFAVKGIGGEGKPIVGKPSTNNIAKIPVFPVGTMTVKELVTTRLKAEPDQAGYCHFPAARDIEFYRMLTAEEKVKRFHKGFAKVEWQKIRSRNEAFDCRCYATAALEMQSIDLKAQRRAALRDYAARVLPPTNETSKTAHKPRPVGTNWATKWKDS